MPSSVCSKPSFIVASGMYMASDVPTKFSAPTCEPTRLATRPTTMITAVTMVAGLSSTFSPKSSFMYQLREVAFTSPPNEPRKRRSSELAVIPAMYTGTVFFFDFDMPSVPKSITTTASAMMDMIYMLSTLMFAPSAP